MISPMPTSFSPAVRDQLMQLFSSAIAAAQPATCLPPFLPPPPARGRLFVLGAGKAAAAMAQATETHYEGGGLSADRMRGFVTTRHGYGLPTMHISVREAGHPVPDQAGIAASQATLDLAAMAGPEDLVLVLLSGGASALWSAPFDGVTLEDKQALTRQMLHAGARIDEMNCVRKHLSRIKGGRLAVEATKNGARLVTCAISDVPRDNPATIGSGPTVPDPSTRADALDVLQRYAITPPQAVAQVLQNAACESPKADDDRFKSTEYKIVGAPKVSLEAAAKQARALGYDILMLGDAIEGEARDVAAVHARTALDAQQAGRKVAILSGGELTVTIRGDGRGGPNQEYALALAVALQGCAGIVAIAGDTDGTDGGRGAADDPAGALVGPDTVMRGRALGLEADAMLQNNDSTGFFDALDDLVRTGPTQTNVNDFRAILVG